MVSTRQMATCSNSGASSGNYAMNFEENPRPSVVTRQTTTNNANTQPYSLVSSQAASSSSSSSTSTLVATGSSSFTFGINAATDSTVQQRHSNDNSRAINKPQLISSSQFSGIDLLDLPEEILANIFSYVGYKKIGQLRNVSKKMNEICMRVLNSNFTRLINKTYNRLHAIKSSMPRRESARRNHPLACECDIIETCYMRLSLLQMTFGKHIERGHCCFFPGAILDEVYSILHYIQSTPHLERPYRVTDELFDLSTMAMEYFRDHIEPTLPDIITYFNKDFFKMPLPTPKRPSLSIVKDLTESSSNLSTPPQSNMVLRKGIRKIKQGMKIYNNQLSLLRNELRTCKRKSAEQGKQISEQQKLIAEQQKQTLEYANRLDENDKKNEEMARKFSTLLQELNKCKTELQYWRSKSPAIPICTSCGQKVIPMLPPEDYQALINQGVKPEDIVLSLGDDIDADVDVDVGIQNQRNPNETSTNIIRTDGVQLLPTPSQSPPISMQQQHLILDENEFAFPNDNTTATLLLINAVKKTFKKYPHNNSNHIQDEIFKNNSENMYKRNNNNINNNSNNNTSKDNKKIDEIAGCSSQIKNGNYCTRLFGGCIERNEKLNLIESNANSAFYAPSTSAAAASSSSSSSACASASASAPAVTSTQHQQHKGVIVSPQSLLGKRKLQAAASSSNNFNSTLSAVINNITKCDETPSSSSSYALAPAPTGNDDNSTMPASCLNPSTIALELNNSNNNTYNNNNNNNYKKARRVQKATRCLNVSGKRST